MSFLTKIFDWMKNNKFATVTLIILAYLLYPQFNIGNVYRSSLDYDSGYGGSVPSTMIGYDSSEMKIAPSNYEAPVTEATDRMVITNSNMSLLVEDVRLASDSVEQKAKALGGYSVNKYINTPFEGGSGYITIRIPLDKRDEMVSFLREAGVRVLSENIDAQDITDQYEDLDAQLAQLEKTMVRLQIIYEQAVTVQDLLNVQSQIQNQQRSIDSVKGRIQSLEAQSKTTLISVNMSTDELALPYSPGAPWRPEVTLKLAIRELTQTMRDAGDWLIWIGVYSIIWGPALVIFLLVRAEIRKYKVRNNHTN